MQPTTSRTKPSEPDPEKEDNEDDETGDDLTVVSTAQLCLDCVLIDYNSNSLLEEAPSSPSLGLAFVLYVSSMIAE